jgi:GGDEF domain-containing protein
MSYAQSRRLVQVVGTLVLALVALVMYLRRVETVEMVAVLLFLPVFFALMQWNVVGGGLAAVGASAVYLGLRLSAIHAVGVGPFSGLIASRVVGLVAFGVLGGWANSQLRASLTKLDLYDQIDDATGLYNARFFVLDTDLEQARATRYRTFFALSLVDVPTSWLDAVPRRQQSRVLRDLGRLLRDSVRTVDRAVHCTDSDRHRLAVILPETAAEGARVFTDRLVVHLTDWLAARGVSGTGRLESTVVTFPGDDDALARVREEFAAIDRATHPPATEPSAHSGAAGT